MLQGGGPVEEEMQTITLPPGVVQDLKDTAWQIDLSVPELIDLIVQGATYKNLDTKKDMGRVNKEGLKQVCESLFEKPHHILGMRRRKVREETPAEDGHWVAGPDGSLTISLPISQLRRDVLQRMARANGVTREEEVARIVQEAVKDDYRPRSEEEWVAKQKEARGEVVQNFRDIFRYIWSGRKRS